MRSNINSHIFAISYYHNQTDFNDLKIWKVLYLNEVNTKIMVKAIQMKNNNIKIEDKDTYDLYNKSRHC